MTRARRPGAPGIRWQLAAAANEALQEAVGRARAVVLLVVIAAARRRP